VPSTRLVQVVGMRMKAVMGRGGGLSEERPPHSTQRQSCYEILSALHIHDHLVQPVEEKAQISATDISV
jgi:hypothetical protein